MKLNCGPTREERKAIKTQERNNKNAARRRRKATPHKWFAWFPVRVGPNDCRWLEYVWRTGEEHFDLWDGLYTVWEYKPNDPA